MSCGVQSPDRQRRTPTEHTIQRGDIPRYVIVKAAYSHARARTGHTRHTRSRLPWSVVTVHTLCSAHCHWRGLRAACGCARRGSRDETPRHSPRPRESSERRETATALYFPVFQKAGSTLKVLYLLLWCSAHHHISVRCKKTNCALRRPTINSVWVCRLGLVTRLSAAPGRAEFFRTRRLLSPSTGGLWMRTRRCWQCGAPLVRSQGLRPAAHTTPHAARCTPHAARRTGFCLMGDAETHGATLVLNSPSGLACKDLPGSHRSAA